MHKKAQMHKNHQILAFETIVLRLFFCFFNGNLFFLPVSYRLLSASSQIIIIGLNPLSHVLFPDLKMG